MKARINALKKSVSIATDMETYPFLRSVALAFCERNCIPQNPLIAETVSAISKKPGINDDGLPPRYNNTIEVFLRDANLDPQKVLMELKSIIVSLEPDIEIL